MSKTTTLNPFLANIFAASDPEIEPPITAI